MVEKICDIIHQGNPAMPHAHLHFLNIIEQQTGDDRVRCRLAWYGCANPLLDNHLLEAHRFEQVVNHGQVLCLIIFEVKTAAANIRIINGYANHGTEIFVIRGQWKGSAFICPTQIQGAWVAFVASFRIHGIDLCQAIIARPMVPKEMMREGREEERLKALGFQ